MGPKVKMKNKKKPAKTKPCPRCSRVRREANAFARRLMENQKYQTESLIKWISEGTQSAVFAFTSVDERKIAFSVDRLMHATIDKVVQAVGLDPKKVPPPSAFEHWGARLEALLKELK